MITIHSLLKEENISLMANSGSKRKAYSGDEEETVRKKALSPEQKEKCADSRARAKVLLLHKRLSLVPADLGVSWYTALQDLFHTDWFRKLSEFVTGERKAGTVYPIESEVWSWTKMTPIQDIKVVILGQDPYHGPGQAHGLCFSVKNGVPPPPSLVNIYKELESDISNFTRPDHGYLAGWAQQGVLLLNAVLTVRKSQPNSHKDRGWERLTDAVIRWISRNLSGVVFLLWGSYAQKKGQEVDKTKHHVLTSVHPSPLSAHRGFLGCKHFSKCNKLLEDQGKEPIDWTDLPKNV